MKDTIREVRELADYDIAKIMGYGHPDDYPKWTRAAYTKEEISKENSYRYLEQKGRITKAELKRYMAVMDARSRAGYESKCPRRSKHHDAVIAAYLDIREDVRSGLTRADIEALIDETHPETVKQRKAEERRQAQARREAKAESQRIRDLPQNKNQPLPDKVILWNEEGYPVTNNVRKRKRLTPSQYNPEGLFQKLFRLLYRGPRGLFQRELDKQVSEEIKETRMKSSAGQAHQDTREYRDGFAGNSGHMPVPGKKPSGRFRRRWGAK
jgi:hypothetical protein